MKINAEELLLNNKQLAIEEYVDNATEEVVGLLPKEVELFNGTFNGDEGIASSAEIIISDINGKGIYLEYKFLKIDVYDIDAEETLFSILIPLNKNNGLRNSASHEIFSFMNSKNTSISVHEASNDTSGLCLQFTKYNLSTQQDVDTADWNNNSNFHVVITGINL